MVAVSGERLRKAANFLTARRYAVRVLSSSLRMRMSSIMRSRSGEMASDGSIREATNTKFNSGFAGGGVPRLRADAQVWLAE